VTVTHHDTRPEEATELQSSPGHRLREARLSAKISVEEVAARLHLDARLIEALENDRYGDLPQPTFVRGYLRGYAHLLNLPSTPIIEAYDRHGFGAPDLIPDIGSKPQAQSSDTSVRLVTYVVILVLVALMVAWWQTQQPELTLGPALPMESGTATDAEMTAPPAAVTPLEPLLAPGPMEATPPTEPLREETPGPAEQTPRALEITPIEETVGVVAAEVPVGISPQPQVAPAPEPDVVQSLAPPPVAVAPPPAVEPDATRPETGPDLTDQLVMRLQHDSWVEVYDREGRQLYFGLARADRTITAGGDGPMRVLLGYARDAQIEYNGQPFDPAPHTQQDVARFTIGEPMHRQD